MRGARGTTGPHGTTACYKAGCRCGRCRAARAAYERERRTRGAEGRPTMVEAGRARGHVRSLMGSSQGKRDGLVGYERVADLAGVSRGVTRALIYGVSGRPPSRKISAENEGKILAVGRGPRDLADHQTVGAGAARERVACLAAFGVTLTRIGRALGTRYPGVRLHDRITVRKEREIERLHWGLWRRHGPFRRHCGCRAPEWVWPELESAS